MVLCVSYVSYLIIMNFDKVWPIYLGRGLRQGDSSHNLYILGPKGLTTLIKQLVARDDIHDVNFVEGQLWCPIYFLSKIVLFFAGLLLPR